MVGAKVLAVLTVNILNREYFCTNLIASKVAGFKGQSGIATSNTRDLNKHSGATCDPEVSQGQCVKTRVG